MDTLRRPSLRVSLLPAVLLLPLLSFAAASAASAIAVTSATAVARAGVIRPVVVPPSGGAVGVDPPGSEAPRPDFVRRVGLDLRDLALAPAHLRSRGWTRLAAGVAAVGVVHLFDDRIRSSMLTSGGDGGRRFAERVRPLGQAGGLALLGAAWVVGEIGHRDGWKATAADGFEATLVSAGIVSPLLKRAFGRPRPNSGDASDELADGGQSLPSGEATEAFALASVLSAHARSGWLKAAAWTAAGAVGWSRMRLDAHWASDVAAGALIGAATGEWIVHRNLPDLGAQLARPERFRWAFAPMAAPSGHGFGVGAVAVF
jgi:membrane-associated phospholipid phosphatase